MWGRHQESRSLPEAERNREGQQSAVKERKSKTASWREWFLSCACLEGWTGETAGRRRRFGEQERPALGWPAQGQGHFISGVPEGTLCC